MSNFLNIRVVLKVLKVHILHFWSSQNNLSDFWWGFFLTWDPRNDPCPEPISVLITVLALLLLQNSVKLDHNWSIKAFVAGLWQQKWVANIRGLPQEVWDPQVSSELLKGASQISGHSNLPVSQDIWLENTLHSLNSIHFLQLVEAQGNLSGIIYTGLWRSWHGGYVVAVQIQVLWLKSHPITLHYHRCRVVGPKCSNDSNVDGNK